MSTLILNPVRTPTETSPRYGFAAALAQFRDRLWSSKPAASAVAAELLARAESYEATQPSYAADLRAAARDLTGVR
jgi:hypothetical protein